MQVYVDESGDPGLTTKPGTSPHFVLTAVVFHDELAASECRLRIRALHQELRWGPRQEFKFNKTDDLIKSRFFEVVRGCRFRHMSLALDKRALRQSGHVPPRTMYAKAATLLFDAAVDELVSAVVVLDRCGSRTFRREISAHIRALAATRSHVRPIKAVRTEHSHSSELIQLADMVVGAIARSLRPDRASNGRWRESLISREAWVRVWPS
jgi:hypothetical protein